MALLALTDTVSLKLLQQIQTFFKFKSLNRVGPRFCGRFLVQAHLRIDILPISH